MQVFYHSLHNLHAELQVDIKCDHFQSMTQRNSVCDVVDFETNKYFKAGAFLWYPFQQLLKKLTSFSVYIDKK